MAAGPKHPAHLAEDLLRIPQVLEHPDAHDEVERIAGEWQLLPRAADDRHAGRPAGQRWRIGVEPGGELYIAPEQLDHPASPTAEVQHMARGGHVASDEGLELVPA